MKLQRKITKRFERDKLQAKLDEVIFALNVLGEEVLKLRERVQLLENPDGVKTTPGGIYYTGSSKNE